jgi:hypothetical protein
MVATPAPHRQLQLIGQGFISKIHAVNVRADGVLSGRSVYTEAEAGRRRIVTYQNNVIQIEGGRGGVAALILPGDVGELRRAAKVGEWDSD